MKELLDNRKLLVSGIVANNRMNRERGILGNNSYRKDLSFNAVEFLEKRSRAAESAAWLDICCGEGRALIETAEIFAGCGRAENPSRSLQIIGIDLAGMFRQNRPELKGLNLLETAVEDFEPPQKFDLITCVHGLHYIGDKLSVIRKAAEWLKADGIFLANLELNNLKLVDKADSGKIFTGFFRNNGFVFNKRKHLLSLQGNRLFDLPFEYLGADDKAGPNYTGQPAVDSYYKF